MIWVCPSCDLEFEPEGHDLDRCRWQQETQLTIFQYSLLRRANQVASPVERERLADLAKRAEAGDGDSLVELIQFMMDLVRKAKATSARG